VVTRRLQAEHRTGSVRRPKTDVLPIVLRNQHMSVVDDDDDDDIRGHSRPEIPEISKLS